MTMFNGNRAYLSPDEGRFLKRGPFMLDLHANAVLLKDRYIQVPPCTFSYLATLARHAPHPVSYQKLVLESQGHTVSRLESQDMARAHIYMLRETIGDEQLKPGYIFAVPGYGYRLKV
jgi:DNA-binding response OmpR family regulator